MADQNKEHENKDAEESGRPVQLDREQQGGQHGGQHDKDKQDKDKQEMEQGQKPGQQHSSNR